jgi:hypothetical protein
MSSREGMAQNDKAWRTLATARFLLIDNDLSLSPSQNHVFCMIFCPHVLLLQCVLTCKTCHALSSLGVGRIAQCVCCMCRVAASTNLQFSIKLQRNGESNTNELSTENKHHESMLEELSEQIATETNIKHLC